MSKFLHNSPMKNVVFGSLALIALMSAASVTPAAAQGAPAGLLRLDPPRASNDIAQLPDEQRAKVRASYARTHKSQVQH